MVHDGGCFGVLQYLVFNGLYEILIHIAAQRIVSSIVCKLGWTWRIEEVSWVIS